MNVVEHRLDAVVELVVAERRHIVAGGVHDADHAASRIVSAESGALDMVARIHENHMFTGSREAILFRRDRRKRNKPVVYVGVGVVRVQHRHARGNSCI